MNLSLYTLKNINSGEVQLPDPAIFDLPEKVLQFGTGVLLRGLPDYFIDKANRSGHFNGRIVVVKSTSQGDSSVFDKQDGLYTLCVRGIEQGTAVEEILVNSSISRVLSASEQWEDILACAHNQQLQIIISNTTEVGIEMVNDDIRHHPPKSYPGKLLAFLFERFKAFGGSEHSGFVIVPTELIPDNGTKLESIVLELAHLNGLDGNFIQWIEEHNYFCNSLVDRIVPGKPDSSQLADLEGRLGYKDGLFTMAEPYRLWAIQGNEMVRSVLSFATTDPGVIITPDINYYRELKLRLLNGTHTLSCGLAFLSGCHSVREAMDDELVSGFIRDLMQEEIAPAIPHEVQLEDARKFGNDVLDRFKNPHIKHLWLSITAQYSSKMRMRCVPVLLKHYEDSSIVPERIALGFASYLFFMKAVSRVGEHYFGEFNGEKYQIVDEQASSFYKRWTGLTPVALVEDVLRDAAFWGEDLNSLPGFSNAVVNKLNCMLQNGVRDTLEAEQVKKEEAA